MATQRKAAKTTKKTTKSAKKRGSGAKRSFRGAMAIATNDRKPVAQRVAAITEAPLAVCQSDQDLQAMLKVLANKGEPIAVRLATLQALQAASFSVVEFESCRGDYLATLRKVAQDPDSELRQRVLGILMREKDGFAQKKLLEGLKNPDKALVPPEKALQLLSYDVHADAYEVARSIVDKPPNEDAKREAVRLLAADATSAPLFEKLLRDKNELREIRQISASALHALEPEKLQKHAREILLDASDYDDIKATSLTALTQFGYKEVAKDQALLNRVEQLKGEGSAEVKQSARQFLSKYRR
jgi:hypothetical protein